MDEKYFEKRREKARQIYDSQRRIYNPFFKQEIILNSDGFHHLQHSVRTERNRNEQLLKFTLLPLGLHILRTATTLQEYRKFLSPDNEAALKDGSIKMKMIEWWGFIAIFVEQEIKIKTIVRKVGDGNIHFWSVMPYSHIRHGKQKLFTEGIEDE